MQEPKLQDGTYSTLIGNKSCKVFAASTPLPTGCTDRVQTNSPVLCLYLLGGRPEQMHCHNIQLTSIHA